MLLTGAYSRTIDEKLRIAIPKRIRDVLDSGGPPALYIAPGTDQTLAIYTEGALTGLADALAQSSPAQQDVRAFRRLFFARAERIELDRQGRFRVPTQLAAMAELGKEVMLLGVEDHLELWSQERWNRYLDACSARYDDIAERAFTPGK